MKTPRFLILLLLLAVVSSTMQAQSKLDFNLQRAAQKSVTAKSANKAPAKVQYVKVIGALHDGESVPIEALERLGIKIYNSSYGVVTMRVPATSLNALDSLSQFRLYETPSVMHINNRLSRTVEHVDELQDSATALSLGLPHTYTGARVVVGVLDSGIDFNHVNFRDSTNNTRIKEAILFRNWTTVEGDNFYDKNDSLLSGKDIMECYTAPSEIDTLTTDYIAESHGTHTSGTAGGSYDGDYLGKDGTVTYTNQRAAAYQCDLVLAGTPIIADEFIPLTLEEMDRYATKAGKPLVVNFSFGNNGKWMDGKNSIEQVFENFTKCGDRPGRVICITSGNEGSDKFTIHQELNETNDYGIWTFLPYRKYTGGKINACFNIYCDTSDSLALEYYIYNYDDMRNAKSRQDLPAPAKHVTKDGFDKDRYSAGKNAGHDNRFAITATIIEDTPITDNDVIAVHIFSPIKKSCRPRIFCLDKSGQIPNGCYSLGVEGFTRGDATSSFSTYACGKGILSVGAWSATNQWKTYYSPGSSIEYSSDFVGNKNFPIGDICSFSSYVVSDDNGLPHPDFCAPGMGVKSGFNVRDTTKFVNGEYKTPDENQVDFICGVASHEFGRKDSLRSWFGNMQGTSMACPNAVSIIALWLQACPTLTMNQIKEVIQLTADRDTCVNERHPERFGAGKINALKGLQYILAKYVETDIRSFDAPNPVVPVRKRLEDGRIIIEKDGKQYSVTGQRLHGKKS